MNPPTTADPGWSGAWELPEVLLRPVDEAGRRSLVAVSALGVGPRRLVAGLARCDDAAQIAGRLEACSPGLHVPPPDDALRALEACGGRLVLPCDDEYPRRLVHGWAPPPLLYVRGRPPRELTPAVAVVGARVASSSGRRYAAAIGQACAAAGFVVVSGLARGVDAAAHEGALRSGVTAAVLDSGIDRIYPGEHAHLAFRIQEAGALMSEFPPGTEPRAWHFPARNRIIATLALSVVVVEAGATSGALITAGMALDAGRDVYTCMVDPMSPSGAGVRKLLRTGQARMVIDVEDLVGLLAGDAAVAGEPVAPRARPLADEAQRRVLDAVLVHSTVDEIAGHTSLPVALVQTLLTRLELDGYVQQEAAGAWSRL